MFFPFLFTRGEKKRQLQISETFFLSLSLSGNDNDDDDKKKTEWGLLQKLFSLSAFVRTSRRGKPKISCAL